MNNHIKFFAFVAFVLAMAAGVMAVPFVASDFVDRFFHIDHPAAWSPADDNDASGLGH